MKITTCTYSGPDSDGEMIFDVKATIENESDHDVELIKTSSLILDDKGIIADGSFNDEVDVYIDPKESDTFSISTPYNCKVDGDLKKIKVSVDALIYRREFYKLGVVDIPKDHKTIVKLDTKSDIGGVVKLYGAAILRGKPDEDGEVSTEVKVGIRNITNNFIERVCIKIVLLDQEDAQLEESTDYESLPPNSSIVISPSIWGMKKNRLRNCKMRISLSVYVPVGNMHAEAVAVEE